MSWKPLFSKALGANPERFHFAAHSHHLWPDASLEAQIEAWSDAASLADHKWEKVMGPLWAEAQRHVAQELNLPDPSTIAFAGNTHDFLIRIFSALPMRPVRVLATNGEFHSFRRQMARWVESGDAVLDTVPALDLLTAASSGRHDLIFASHVLFSTGEVLGCIEELSALARPAGPWVVIDGYHGFMAIPTDLANVWDRIFYLAGGYKYAMAGEGACFLHAPPRFAPAPAVTGWYAEFEALSSAPGKIGFAPDARRFLGSTFDPSGLYRFNAVRRLLGHNGLTTARISAHVAALQRRFLAARPFPSLSLLNPLTEGAHARFLAFQGAGAAAIHDALGRCNVTTDIRGDVLRIGFAIYHDEDDIDRLIDLAVNA